jgi:transcriptional regulator with XRE-family HTH domain
MKTTPQTAKVLAGALKMHGWQQADLANRSKIAAQTLSLHLNGSRPINDDHLALYITALDKGEQSRLVSAWLQDTLPADVIANVLDSTTHSVREEVRTWRPGLTPEQAEMMDWWAAKLAEDDELARIFHAITSKAGWQPTPIHPAPKIIHFASGGSTHNQEHHEA